MVPAGPWMMAVPLLTATADAVSAAPLLVPPRTMGSVPEVMALASSAMVAVLTAVSRP